METQGHRLLKEGYLKVKMCHSYSLFSLGPNKGFRQKFLRLHVDVDNWIHLEIYNGCPQLSQDHCKQLFVFDASDLKIVRLPDIAYCAEVKAGTTKHRKQCKVRLKGTSHSEIESWLDCMRNVSTSVNALLTADNSCRLSILDNPYSVKMNLNGRYLTTVTRTEVNLLDTASLESQFKMDHKTILLFAAVRTKSIVDQDRVFKVEFCNTKAAYTSAMRRKRKVLWLFCRDGMKLKSLIADTYGSDGKEAVGVLNRARLISENEQTESELDVRDELFEPTVAPRIYNPRNIQSVSFSSSFDSGSSRTSRRPSRDGGRLEFYKRTASAKPPLPSRAELESGGRQQAKHQNDAVSQLTQRHSYHLPRVVAPPVDERCRPQSAAVTEHYNTPRLDRFCADGGPAVEL